ncbi:FAD:protein FMN transferase [Ruminococcus sp. Marseille-P6503]|uniref:FAD:protein FMN transferase n=1 Tax=Ruminococcus sp. Marseille-P6503 TaxID=2364796 RepID=UPI000F51CD80|nr:FAD:protein FMN transferase [Ruminococcus sp. Marseille-P6503]
MRFSKSLAVCLAAAAMIAAGALMSLNGGNDMTRTVRLVAMDCVCTVTASSKADISQYTALVRELDKQLSAYDEASDISRINSSSEPVSVSRSTERLIKRAVSLNELYPHTDCTAGRLIDLWSVTGDDPHVPKENEISAALETIGSGNIVFTADGIALENGALLNFGCCAKGFALDEIKKLLDESGEQYAVITFGSSSLVYGQKPDKTAFVTDIQNPNDPAEAALSFESGQCFISTSGGYERFFTAQGKQYSHIFDLETGYPAETDLTSVTVISAGDGMLTDFLSTEIYIGGTETLGGYLDSEEFQVIALDENNNIYCSESLRDSIEIKNTDFHFA